MESKNHKPFQDELDRLHAIHVYLNTELEKIEEQYNEAELALYKHLQAEKRKTTNE